MKQYKYIGDSDELTTKGKVYNVNQDGDFIDDTGTISTLCDGFEKYFEEVKSELQQLIQDRIKYKSQEKDYNDTNPKEYLKAHKLRKQTEKAIFKILENDING